MTSISFVLRLLKRKPSLLVMLRFKMLILEIISSPPPQIDIFSDVVEDDVDIKERPKTPPPRSSSPDDIRECPKIPPTPRCSGPDDIYTDESPGLSYPIPHKHLKLKGFGGQEKGGNQIN